MNPDTHEDGTGGGGTVAAEPEATEADLSVGEAPPSGGDGPAADAAQGTTDAAKEHGNSGLDNAALDDAAIAAARGALGNGPLVLVGLMGAGKTTVGRQVAQMLGLPFTDADEEIEAVSRMSVADLFAAYGEDEFRALERRVIARLLEAGPGVLATGGGAFINEETRRAVKEGALSVWLSASLDLLVERTAKRSHRPLLRTGDPRAILGRLIEERYPIYAEADLTVDSRRQKREAVAARVIQAVARHAASGQRQGEEG